MRQKMRHFAILLSGAAAIMASTSSMACSLEPVDPLLIKQMMAKEIAYRLGIQAQQIPLSKITEPKLHAPLGLGADCSGLWAHHHSSGFRIRAAAVRPDSEPAPEIAAAPAAVSTAKTTPHSQSRAHQPQSPDVKTHNHSPRICNYEGVAVLLGYDAPSPVAVNFEQLCD